MAPPTKPDTDDPSDSNSPRAQNIGGKDTEAARRIETAVSKMEHVSSLFSQETKETRSAMDAIKERLTKIESALPKDLAERLRALEVKVDALPSKVWIGGVVLGGMTLLATIVALIAHFVRH